MVASAQDEESLAYGGQTGDPCCRNEASQPRAAGERLLLPKRNVTAASRRRAAPTAQSKRHSREPKASGAYCLVETSQPRAEGEEPYH